MVEPAAVALRPAALSGGGTPGRVAPRSIGLAVDTVGSYGRSVIQGVMEFCHRHPHWVIGIEPRLWSYDREPEPETWAVDGVIIQAYEQGVVDRVRAAGLAAVNVANMGAVAHRPPTVVPDDSAIGRMAADYLLSIGFPHYGCCTHDQYEFAALRREAFVEQVRRTTHGRADVSVCDTADAAAGDDALDRWLRSVPKPVGVFCCNDFWAHRTLTAARRVGLRVPDEVAVLGVDDDELLNTVGALPLSSIAVPAVKIGYTAAAILEDLLNGDGPPPPPITRLPPLNVVARATTDVTFVDDADVSAALAFVRANVARPLGVEDVLDHLSISRRSLERRFRATVGRSVATEIRRAHVERAKHLLVNTTLSVDEVAAASGFTSATLLGVVFRKAVGESPTAFRRRAANGR